MQINVDKLINDTQIKEKLLFKKYLSKIYKNTI